MNKSKTNIAIIGYPGCNKTITGKLLSIIFNIKFVDTDALIEGRVNLAVSGYISQHGQKKFLQIQEDVILNFNLKTKCVISAGGSVIYSPPVMNYLKKHCIILFFFASLKRVDFKTQRFSGKQIINPSNLSDQDLYMQRLSLYQKYMDFQVNIDDIPQFLNNSVIENIIQQN